MKPRLFIGSSAESLPTLKKVEDILSDTCDCIVWTKAFSQNKSNLDSLITQTRVADFSILIAMADDIVLKKNEVKTTTRDNVIFEFGLFLGSTGINHSFLFAEESIDLPSDLDGITFAKFSLDNSKYNSIQNICQHLKTQIDTATKSSKLGLLPSTALAIGYYYSFIKKVCEELHDNAKVFIGKDAETREVNVKNFQFKVIIPEDLDDNGVENFKTIYNKKNELKHATTASISSSKRGYPFVFKIEPPGQNIENPIDIHLYDVPTTLNTIVETIRLFMPTEQIGKNEDIERLEKRELSNFSKTLRYLISKNVSTKDNVIVEEGVKAK